MEGSTRLRFTRSWPSPEDAVSDADVDEADDEAAAGPADADDDEADEEAAGEEPSDTNTSSATDDADDVDGKVLLLSAARAVSHASLAARAVSALSSCNSRRASTSAVGQLIVRRDPMRGPELP